MREITMEMGKTSTEGFGVPTCEILAREEEMIYISSQNETLQVEDEV